MLVCIGARGQYEKAAIHRLGWRSSPVVGASPKPQQATTPIVGFMSGRSPDDSSHLVAAFHRGLGETGFVEGKNLKVEYRWALGQYDRLPAFAAELVKRPVTILVAVGGDVSAVAAKKATSTIPIVFGMGGDPIKAELVDSLGRPGGNATGYTLLTNELEPKRRACCATFCLTLA